MTVLVLGATARNLAMVTTITTARRIRLATRLTRRRPDWALVATPTQRLQVLDRHGLPTYRVIRVSALSRDGELRTDSLVTAVERFEALGGYKRVPSPIGVAVTTWLMPWIARRLDEAFGSDIAEEDRVIRLKHDRAQARARRESSETRSARGPARP